MNLPRWSLRNPVTASMVIVSIIVLGGVSATRLPLAFLPEVDFPGVQVEIPYPNALPAQVGETRKAGPAGRPLRMSQNVRKSQSARVRNTGSPPFRL